MEQEMEIYDHKRIPESYDKEYGKDSHREPFQPFFWIQVHRIIVTRFLLPMDYVVRG